MATKSKQNKPKKFNLLEALVKVQQTLVLLDQFVDVDRLIGISNAQGPVAKTIKDVLRPEHLAELEDEVEHLPPPPAPPRTPKPAKRKALSQ